VEVENMGDRVSIQFEDESKQKSPVLFSHWRGMDFVKYAEKYAKGLAKRKRGKSIYPIDRMESQTVMVDFIRDITKDTKEVQGDLYLGRTPKEGDNSDNGHHIIMLRKVI
jgi:hypothetical protein